MPEAPRSLKLASPEPPCGYYAPVRDPFLRTIAATIARRRLLRPRDSVLVAVSGGPDSVALLTALAALLEGRSRMGVAHVNHRLRGAESARDERFVVALAARLGLDLVILDGRVSQGGNLEERAREIRYRLLLEAAREGGYEKIATGHTRDDQAETFLLRLLRGAGARGLAGIPSARADGVIRPLLDVRRRDVVAFLARRNLRFRRDRSNADPHFTRNRVRRRLLPMLEREFNPRIRDTLARTAEILAEEDELLDAKAERRLARSTRDERLDVAALRNSPAAIARRVVRLWLERVRGSRRGPSGEHVDAVLVLAEGTKGGSLTLPGGIVRKSGSFLRWLGRKTPVNLPRRSIALSIPGEAAFGEYHFRAREVRARAARPSRWRAVFDADVLARRLDVRVPRAGDRVRPIGLGGTKKLQDVFVDARVDREIRATYPVVERAGEIIWVPGLVRSDVAPVTNASRRVVVLACARR